MCSVFRAVEQMFVGSYVAEMGYGQTVYGFCAANNGVYIQTQPAAKYVDARVYADYSVAAGCRFRSSQQTRPLPR